MALLQEQTAVLVNGTNLDEMLDTDLPVLLLIWNGETLRTDVKSELDKAAQENNGCIRVVKADVSKNPEVAERFDLGKHPLLIGWLRGEVLARRNRPWNTDVQGMVEELLKHAPAPVAKPTQEIAKAADKAIADGKPVKVTDDTFEKEVLASPLPVLVDFWAEWCGPCKMIGPILEKLATEFAGKIRIAKVDVDANPMLSQALQVTSIPLLMFVKNGKVVGQQAGALPENVLRNAIQQLIALKV
ncbi:MAG: thioredoxin [Chloroflexota bacterium]